jgi:uncharacterized HhH-GPD family protein
VIFVKEKQIIYRLSEFSDKLYNEGRMKELVFVPDNSEANNFVITNKNAYLFGVLFDWGQRAERAWAYPWELKNRLGDLDVKKIAEMRLIVLVKIFRQKPQLRMPVPSACFTLYASQLLVEKYQGNASNIWSGVDDGNIILSRINEFYGIGQKKASMVLNALVRDFGHEIKDKSMIDVSYDRHIKKVFLRTGLVDKIDEKTIIQKAKMINPVFPGKLDLPCWIIGREWCSLTDPRCDSCKLSDCCGKTKLEITNFD